MLVVKDAHDLKYIRINKTGENLLGMSSDDMIGKSDYDFFPKEQAEKIAAIDKDVIKTGELLEIQEEEINTLKNGKRILHTKKIPLYDEEGKPKYLLSISEDITLSKFYQERIESSEKKFRALFETSRDAILLLNEKGFFDCNKAALEMFDYSKSQLLKLHPGDISPEYQPNNELSIDATDRYMQRAYIEKLSVFEWVHKKKDGTVFPAEVLLSPFVVDEKHALHAVIRDISDRIKAQDALKQSEEKFRKLSESSPAIISFQKVDKYLYVNPAWEKLTGYNKEEALNMSVLDVVHPEFKEKVKKREIARLKGKKVPQRYDLKLITRTNEIKWINIAFTIINYEGEKVLLSVANDITELKYAQQTIKSSERKFKSLFYDNHSVMLLINPNKGQIVDANQAACNYYGYKVKQLTSMNINQINTFSKKEIKIEMENARNERRNHFYFKHKLANNKIKDVEVYSGKVQVEEKEFLYSIIHDITERKEAEEGLRKSEIELRLLNAQKDRFFSIISHDLKGPIGNFLQFAELLKNNYKSLSEEKTESYINHIYSLASNTYRLLENLLIWTRSQLGKIEVEKEVIDLKIISEEVIELIDDIAQTKEINIINNIHLGKLAYADKNCVQTVLRNLINNAVKFTNRHGEIILEAVENGDVDNNQWIEISVSDNGIGMTKKKLRKLFKMDENVSTKGTEQEKGTGLGLLLCKELINKNGGDIRVESKEGEGSKFTFKLQSEFAMI